MDCCLLGCILVHLSMWAFFLSHVVSIIDSPSSSVKSYQFTHKKLIPSRFVPLSAQITNLLVHEHKCLYRIFHDFSSFSFNYFSLSNANSRGLFLTISPWTQEEEWRTWTTFLRRLWKRKISIMLFNTTRQSSQSIHLPTSARLRTIPFFL